MSSSSMVFNSSKGSISVEDIIDIGSEVEMLKNILAELLTDIKDDQPVLFLKYQKKLQKKLNFCNKL